MGKDGHGNAGWTPVGALAAAALAVAICWPILFGGQVAAFGDNVSFWAPNTAFWMATVRAGGFPLWNPHILGGIPFAADINHGLFYPPHWIVFAMGLGRGTGALIALHVALGAFGMFLLLRALGISGAVSLWGAALLAFSESFLPLANHVVMLEAMSWGPLALYFVVRLTQGAGIRAALQLGAVMALSALAGDVHATYIIALAAGTLFAALCAGKVFAGEVRPVGRAAALAALGGVTALLLAAVALVPAFECARLTERGAPSVEYAAYHALDPEAVAGMVLPGVWGQPSRGNAWNFRWSDNAYLGMVLLALAAFGARRARRGAAGIALAAVGAGLAFGQYSPLWRLACAALPGFSMFRQPREYFFIAVLGVILLAAQGLSDLAGAGLSRGGRKRRAAKSVWRRWVPAVTISGAAVAAAIAFFLLREQIMAAAAQWKGLSDAAGGAGAAAWLISPAAQAAAVALVAALALALKTTGILSARAAAGVIAAAVFVDYAILASAVIVTGPPAAYGAPEAVVAAGNRIVPRAEGFGEYFERYAARNIRRETAAAGDPGTTLANVKRGLVDNEVLHLPLHLRPSSVLGYSTFVPLRYAALYEAVTRTTPSAVRLRFVDGADYSLLGADAAVEAPAGRSSAPATVPLSNRPHARMAWQWRPAADFEQAAAMVRAEPDLMPFSPVVEGLPHTISPVARPSWRGDVRPAMREPGRAAFEVFTDDPGLLIVEESFYPGWTATLNGAPAAIYPANLAFRAVYVPAGNYIVEFRFMPRSLALGAFLSAAALLLATSLFISAGKDPA